MKIFKDKKIILLAILLLVFTIVYFVFVNKISYAFSSDNNSNIYYKKLIETIEKCAIVYGEKNPEIFNDDKIIYIKVQDLVDEKLLLADENGKVKNPLNYVESLNSKIIKIKKENNKINVEVDS